MLNKKIVAAAVAAAFTQGAVATVDIDGTGTQKITYASELVTAGSSTLDVTNASNLLDVVAEVGFTIGDGTSKYVRVDLTDATFGSAASLTSSNGTALISLSQGGTDGKSFAIFEVAATGGVDVLPSDTVTLAAASYDVSASETSKVCYALYETAVAAANQTAGQTLKNECSDFTELASVLTGAFAVANADNVATVNSGFTKFSASSLGATSATVGYLDTELLISATTNAFNSNGTAVTAADIIAVTDGTDNVQDLTINGDLSFGTWTLQLDSADCSQSSTVVSIATAAATAGSFGTVAGLSPATLTAGDWHICVEVDGSETIKKSDYTAELAEAGLTDDLGRITYDTTSIEVPYLTTFADYNQRLYIVNSGSTNAEYSISFVSEAGVTVTPGTAATGVVPAGEMVALRATDVVALEGRTRTSAVIEVEGVDLDIQAATQTVNLSTGATDTVVLNANSIKSRLKLD